MTEQFKNYVENKVGGVDCEYLLNGEYVPYTLDQSQIDALDGETVIEPIDPTILDALQAEQDVIEAKALAKQQKLEGIEIFGVMCSATAEDQHGLTDIKGFALGGHTINFKFENGNKLPLTKDNIAEFESIWFPFRMSFFQ